MRKGSCERGSRANREAVLGTFRRTRRQSESEKQTLGAGSLGPEAACGDSMTKRRETASSGEAGKLNPMKALEIIDKHLQRNSEETAHPGAKAAQR